MPALSTAASLEQAHDEPTTPATSSPPLGLVRFCKGFCRIVGPSLFEAARFVRKVSSFLQVVATPPGAANVLDLARSNPV
jgi:hypothetical protein